MSENFRPETYYNPDKEGGKNKETENERLIREGIDVKHLSPEQKAAENRKRVEKAQQKEKEKLRKREEEKRKKDIKKFEEDKEEYI